MKWLREWCWSGTPVWKALNLVLMWVCFGAVWLTEGAASWWMFGVFVLLLIRDRILEKDLKAWRVWRKQQDQ